MLQTVLLDTKIAIPKNSDMTKHTENHGIGTQTNEYFRRNRLYKVSEDEFLRKQFKNFSKSYKYGNNR